MGLQGPVLLCCLLLTFSGFSVLEACSMTSYTELSEPELLYKASIVVTGKVTGFKVFNGSMGGDSEAHTDMTFEVYCILKDDAETVNKDIVIEWIEPQSTCSGTKTNFKEGEELLVLLDRTEHTANYMWDNVNNLQSSVWELTPTNLAKKGNIYEMAGQICGLQKPKLPEERPSSEKYRCPNITIAEEECIVSGAQISSAESLVVTQSLAVFRILALLLLCMSLPRWA